MLYLSKADKNMGFARQQYFDEFLSIKLFLSKLLINLSTSYQYSFQNHTYALWWCIEGALHII